MSLRSFLKRLGQMIPTAFAVASLVFFLIHLVPGDPVQAMLGEGAQPAELEALREGLGLDRPVRVQYFTFLRGLLQGDLGESFHSGEPVTELLIRHFQPTVELALSSLLVALLISLPLGFMAALHRGDWPDGVSRFVALLGVSIPNFWLGPMLILALAIRLDWFPVSGRGGLAHLVLPSIAMGTALAGLLTRMIRTSVAEELAEPYVLAAAARGLSSRRILFFHVARNAALPVVTIIGLQFGALLTGAMITETIFSWPGLGRLLIGAIHRRDYPLVQGGILFFAIIYLLVNFAVDILYLWIDPRVDSGETTGK